MRKMTNKERKTIETEIRKIFSKGVSDEYSRYILESEDADGVSFMDDVVEDVMCASAWDDEGYYNSDDIVLAIGRVLMDRLDINY